MIRAHERQDQRRAYKAGSPALAVHRITARSCSGRGASADEVSKSGELPVGAGVVGLADGGVLGPTVEAAGEMDGRTCSGDCCWQRKGAVDTKRNRCL